MVLVNQYIVRLVLKADAPEDAFQVIKGALPNGWQMVGSTLEAPPGTSSVEASMIALDLADKIDWFADSVSSIDLLRVTGVEDLSGSIQRRPE